MQTLRHSVTSSDAAWAQRSHRALPKVPVPSLGSIEHRAFEDLGRLRVILIGRPILAVAGFAIAAVSGWWIPAVALTWLVYGSTLTAVHHLIHSGLGLSPRARYFWLSALSALVVESGHALQVTHLTHHRADRNLPDPEGYIENVTWRQLPVAALKFRYRLALWGWRNAPRSRRISQEMGFHAAAHIASLALLPITPLPWIYLSLIHLASFAFAVLAGKGPQTNFGRPVDSPLVKVHTVLGALMFFSHDRHLEHHMYPKVPLPRLRRLKHVIEPALADLDIVHVQLVV